MRSPLPPGVELMTADVSAGAWLNERLLPLPSPGRGVPIGSIVPTGFPAYARIGHPASPGSMPRPVLALLLPILERHTATAGECWSCVWDGFGFLDGGAVPLSAAASRLAAWRRRLAQLRSSRRRRRELATLPTVRIHPSPDGRGAFRAYLLFRGPLSAVEGFHLDGHLQSPNYLWPGDRTWCLVTEIDHSWSYVGGSADLVRDLLDSPIDVVRSHLASPIDVDD